MPLVLGVDCSTQSTKVELRDADSGALVGEGRAPHPPTTPPRSEQDPARWWEALGLAAAAALARPGLARSVGAVSVAAQQHGLVALDSGGEVLRPAKLWNDTESAPDADWLVGALGGPQRWAQACGSVPTAAFTVAKLSWLHRQEPAAFGALTHVLLPHDWLSYRLSGALVTDRGDASGTGYWSPAEERWRPDLLAVVAADKDWGEMLPRVLGPAEAAGALTPAAAGHLGVAAGLPVGPGTGDNMGAALRLAMAPGDVAVSIGTSGTVYTVSPAPTADALGEVAGFADATGRYLPLVCTLNATRVTDAMARLVGLDRAEFAAAALSAPAGAGGVVLVPYFDGERTPNRPRATGLLGGLRSDVEPALVARASFEGVVAGLLEGLDALVRAGVASPARLLLTGGGARDPAYRRVLADLAQLPVVVPEGVEHVAGGACVQAAAVLHGCAPEEVARAWAGPPAAEVDPDPGVEARAVRAAYAGLRG
ncbi:MAG TPA: xylulokinase [Acidimicrobiales bacterium]|nr:xylulokinase [Acidimicrobiales bacterium]